MTFPFQAMVEPCLSVSFNKEKEGALSLRTEVNDLTTVSEGKLRSSPIQEKTWAKDYIIMCFRFCSTKTSGKGALGR